MDLTGKITLGSCLLYGFLAHLTNFGGIWVLPSVSCMSCVCQASSLSASPCSWQKLQTGALCTTKERLSFLHECTKYLPLGIVRLSQGSLNYAHDHHSSFKHQEKAGLQMWLEAEGSGDSWLSTCAGSIVAFTGLLVRGAWFLSVLSPNCAWFVFVRCAEQEAVCEPPQSCKPWLCVVGNLLKPSLTQTRKASPNPWAYEGLPDMVLACSQRRFPAGQEEWAASCTGVV